MMAALRQKGFLLGDSRVNPHDGSIDRRSGAGDIHAHVEPRVMNLLLALARHPGQVVSRRELMRQVWGREDVCTDTLNRCMSELRQALGDDYRHPRYIETVSGKGYRLLATPGELETRIAALRQDASAGVATTATSGDSRAESQPARRGPAALFAELKQRKVFRIAMAYGVMAWGLVQTMDVLWPHLPFPEWPLALMVVLAILGFPVALVMAWVFEVTPDGVVVDMPVRESRVASAELSRRSIDFVIIGALVIVVGVQAYLLLSGSPESERTEQGAIERVIQAAVAPASVAVLPFAERGAGAGGEGLGEGLASEIVAMLSDIEGLRVVSRTSSFAFRGANLSVMEIGQQLGVATVLDGSVSVENGVLHVSAQLVDARSQFNLWSRSFRRPLQDIFAIQSEITHAVMGQLDALAGIVRQPGGPASERRPTSNVEAYRLYLQAGHLLPRRDRDLTLKSLELLKQAVGMDAGFARAHARLAWASMLAGHFGWLPRATAAASAERSARLAIGLNPDLADAHAVLAALHGGRGEFAAAELAFRDAVARDSRSDLAQHWFAAFLFEHGRLREALSHARQAYDIDPASPSINGTLAAIHLALDELDQASEFWERAGDLGLRESNYLLGVELALLKNDSELALRNWRNFLEARGIDWDRPGTLLRAVLERRDEQGRDSGFNVSSLLESGLDPSSLLLALTLARSSEYALQALTQMVQQRGGGISAAWSPLYAEIRQLPGFSDLLRDAGFAEYWQASTFPDLCTNLDGELACR